MIEKHIIYRMSQEECAILQESVPYVKLYRYNPKHLYPKLNGYGDLRFIYEEYNQCVSVRLGRQGAFKSSALWCVRAGKGLRQELDHNWKRVWLVWDQKDIQAEKK